MVYPSCFYYPNYMSRLELKTSQLLLASYLARYFPVEYADFEISIGRANSELQVKRYTRQVRKFLEEREFDILAISCWTSLSYQATLVTARICRELYPDRLIVVGGYHPSARPQDFITDDKVVDYVLLGEGELTLKDIADDFGHSGRPAGTVIAPCKTLPGEQFVDYDWTLLDGFVSTHFPDGIPSLYLYLSRGCPFGCTFCMEPLKERKWRAYPPETAINILQTAANRFKAYSIAISDACFGMRTSWRKEFLKLLEKLKPEYWLIFETRPEYLDAEDIKMLCGLKVEVQFGIESGSADMLSLMKKTRQPRRFLDRFSDISRMLSEHDILHRANLIFNHPGETRQTLRETFDFIDHELERRDSTLIWAPHGYMHFPGCELDRNMEFYCDKFGSRFISTDWWKGTTDQYENSLKFIPSTDLEGNDTDMWRRMIAEREEKFKTTLSPRAFRFAANKYRQDWKNDARYEESKKALGLS